MKYYVLKYRYLHTTSQKGNLGDNIQSIAAVNILKKLGISEANIGYVNRDELALCSCAAERGIFVAQGWFGCMPGQKTLPVNDSIIHPLYFGFHINEGSWHILRNDARFPASLKKYEPVGCRDRGTRDFLRGMGVKAFFSGCLTSAFELRRKQPNAPKTFLIDPPRDILAHIPDYLREGLESMSQEDYSGNGYSPSGQWPMTENDVLEVNRAAIARLDRLRAEATMVVTGRIHVAMPCAAMGIPVIYCYHNAYDARASVVKEFLPIHEMGMLDRIDWEIKAPDMEEYKKKLQLMFAYRLQTEEKRIGLSTNRLSKNDFLRGEALVEDACIEREDTPTYKTKSFMPEDFLRDALGNHRHVIAGKKKKLILFGAGSAGIHISGILKYCGVIPDYFCDNSIDCGSAPLCNNIKVLSFKSLKDNYRDSIILITTKNYFGSIKRQLLDNGFSDKQIIGNLSFIEQYIDFALPEDIH